MIKTRTYEEAFGPISLERCRFYTHAHNSINKVRARMVRRQYQIKKCLDLWSKELRAEQKAKKKKAAANKKYQTRLLRRSLAKARKAHMQHYPSKTKVPIPNLELFTMLYMSGSSLFTIAKQFNVTAGQVAVWAKMCNLER